METGTDNSANGQTIDITFELNDVCTLCGGEERIPVNPFYTTVDQHFYHYWLCKCGMMYLNCYAQDQREFYTVLRPSSPEARHSPSAIERQTRMAKELPIEWKIRSHLDVGCGTDGLMDQLEEKYGCESEGVDYNPRYTLSHKRYNELSEVEKQYDLVTALHVLEHVPDPHSFLREIVRVSKRYIAIEVPSIGIPTKGNAQHINIFSPWTFRRAIEQAGIRIIKIEWVEVKVQKVDQLIHSAALVCWGMV